MGRITAKFREDIQVALERDPAVTSPVEVLFYPYLHAIWAHRISHILYMRNHRVTARVLSLLARFASSGIDIHPGARIGRRFFIDHGASVVIGETAVIGDDVTLYHNVTLGSLGWWRDRQRRPGEQRHPNIGDNVIIGANSSVLGPVTIGTLTKVGAHSLVLESVPPNAAVRAARATVVFSADKDDLGSSEDGREPHRWSRTSPSLWDQQDGARPHLIQETEV